MTPDEKLKKIAEILDFGNELDAYYNLEGAIEDLDKIGTGMVDYVSMNTLRRVQKQLSEVHKVLKC